jgi:hypothetical protein
LIIFFLFAFIYLSKHKKNNYLQSLYKNKKKFHRSFLFNKLKFKQRSCLDQIDKNRVCNDYCTSLIKKFNDNDTQEDNFIIDLNKNNNNQTGEAAAAAALHYYQSFIHKFLSTIKHDKLINLNDIEKLRLKLEIELTKHEINKLHKFSDKSLNNNNNNKSTNGDVDVLHDITDILKNMLSGIVQDSLFESVLLNEDRGALFDSALNGEYLSPTAPLLFNEYVRLGIILAVTSVFLLILASFIYLNRLRYRVNLRIILAIGLVGMFVISAVNNHAYLTQKKQILNQQRLKEMIPEECLLNGK